MKRTHRNFLCIFILSVFMAPALYAELSFDVAPFLRLGTYALEGSSLGSDRVSYEGQVDIYENGDNFLVKWRIGNYQSQTGTGVLVGRTLSVSFYDDRKNQHGVVGFYLTRDGYLEGLWTTHGSYLQGKENLRFLR